LTLSHDAVSLARCESWKLVCAHVKFNLSFRPSGTDGYDDLIRDARMGNVGGHDLPVASLVDIIRSRSAAGRPDDVEALPTLYEALERQGNLLSAPTPPALSEPELATGCGGPGSSKKASGASTASATRPTPGST
jgi:hypothetical protein